MNKFTKWRCRRRAKRLATMIEFLGQTEAVEYGRRRGWIDDTKDNTGYAIYLRKPGKP